ncbi:MAG: type II toxin-antitoxin system Phd/YefM family antitoxin [Gaiellaceae bacterium]
MSNVLGVAEAKRRFSELIDRVRSGERFVVTRRGRAVVALVPPEATQDAAEPHRYLGLAAFAGALAEWKDMDEFVREVYEARRRARDRPAPDLG